MKYLIAALFVLILGALAWACRAMLTRTPNTDPKNKTMARALAWRVGLSILAFALIWLSHAMGWIQPTGIPLQH